jgi:osmoprotectant transport system substrate-binding protein
MRRGFAAAAIALLVVAVGCSQETSQVSGEPSPKDGPKITVGSANFAESQILAEIYAGGLKDKGFPVSTKLNIGARDAYFPALVKGSLDFFPEYTGSALAYLSKDPSASKPDEQTNYDNLVAQLEKKKLAALEMASAQDSDGIVVNKQTADKYSLKTLSDLEPHASELVMGGPPECPKRFACLLGLKEAYGIEFKEFKPLDVAGPLTVKALKENAVQVANLFTTQSAIAANDFVLLEQDKTHIAGAENIVPIVRQEILDAYGTDFQQAVDAITAKITTENLTGLNKRVEIDKEDASDVAADWLKTNNLT